MFEREKEEGEGRVEKMNKGIIKIAKVDPKEIDLIMERDRKIWEEEENSRIEKKRKQESRKSDNKNMDYALSSGIAEMFRRIGEE